MSIVPVSYDFDREMESLTNKTFFDNFELALYPHRTDVFKANQLPFINLFHPIFLDYPLNGLWEIRTLGNDKEIFTIDKDGFQVSVYVRQYKANELTVKTANNYVVVEGKHEERNNDNGYIQKHFVRKYLLPKGYRSEDVISTVSSDGVLIVKVPPPQKTIDNQERVVKVQETGLPYSALKYL